MKDNFLCKNIIIEGARVNRARGIEHEKRTGIFRP